MENNTENMSIDLKLTVQQINVILGALAETPFRIAQPLVAAIQEQAAPQLQAPEAVEVEKKKA